MVEGLLRRRTASDTLKTATRQNLKAGKHCKGGSKMKKVTYVKPKVVGKSSVHPC